MNVEELVRSWKQPKARGDRAADHPSGQIALRPGGGAHRSRLLSGFDDQSIIGTLTVTVPFAPEAIG
ncbi:hypothetical protein ACIQVT_12305 [Streptomyces sp. NPDC100445]|uniref:hypothetical protein n=1 Tax=Streptomyces sp. NPDC100445 TaxID=3366102 RepID=UPI003808308A